MRRSIPVVLALALTVSACSPELLQSVLAQLKSGQSLEDVVVGTIETYTGEEVTFTEEEQQTFRKLPEATPGDLTGNWYMFGDTFNLMQLTQTGSEVTGTVTNRSGHKGTVTGKNDQGHVHLRINWGNQGAGAPPPPPPPAGQPPVAQDAAQTFQLAHAGEMHALTPLGPGRRMGQIRPPKPGRPMQGPPPKIEMQLILHNGCLVGRRVEIHPGGRANHMPVFFLSEKDGQIQACEELGFFPHVDPNASPAPVPSATASAAASAEPSSEPSAEASAEPSAEPSEEPSASASPEASAEPSAEAEPLN